MGGRGARSWSSLMKDVPGVCIEDAMANTNPNFEKGEEWEN